MTRNLYFFCIQNESSHALKIGNIAPDIVFTGDVFQNGQSVTTAASLSEANAEYIVVVFGSSLCPMCPQELSAIKRVYDKWKRYGVEVVYVSLDENRSEFVSSSSAYPFISFSDYIG